MIRAIRNLHLMRDASSCLLHRSSKSLYRVPCCGEANWKRSALRDLYERRREQGPEKLRHRSEFYNWNYEAEVFSFGARLQEKFDTQLLKTALTNQSFIELQREKRIEKGLSGEELDIDMETNEQLTQAGLELSSSYIQAYLRHNLPLLPEEGIISIHNHLMSTEMLSHVASHLGVADVALCADFPVEPQTLRNTFLAVIGVLGASQGVERAQRFVQDLILVQLTGKLLDELWEIHDPVKLLASVLQKQGRAEPEPRLLWSAGSSTVVAAYQAGIYSDKRLIGKGYGETTSTAEEMAARDALRRLFGLKHNRTPFNFEFSQQHVIDTGKLNQSLKQLTS